MKKILLSVFPPILLASCVSSSQVAKIDRDTYVVSSSSTSVFIDNQKLLTDSADKARNFCYKQNKDMIQESDRYLGPERGAGRRQFMFYFQCVNKNN